ATENITDYYPVSLDVFQPHDDLFILKVKGESMIEAGILDGDFVIVEQKNTAANGDIIAAIIDGEATVKRYYREKDHIRLQPENCTMKPILVKEVFIAGKIIGMFRKF
ncbi:MAG: transcriptional repressor LexA, partial [Clostridiales bacterium]